MRDDSAIRWAWAGPAAIGALTFLVIHLFLVVTWERWFAWMQVHEAWWLNSDSSTVVTLSVVLIVAFVACFRSSWSPWLGALAMLGGIGLSMTIILILVGPGNLWPIVLVFGMVLNGAAVFLGAAAAVAARKLVRRGPSGPSGGPTRPSGRAPSSS